MPVRSLLFLVLLLSSVADSFSQLSYSSLDAENPIYFNGTSVIYQSDTFLLGPHCFFIDGNLNHTDAAKHPYVFTSVKEALLKVTAGTKSQPMKLLIAPYVYWIDNPDDPEIRVPQSGATPYAMVVDCPWLQFYGLNPNPGNVVLACNRGQTLGADGNFTLFKLLGDGIRSENITFGNYCNVDLNYPLKPGLNRKKRSATIVQAQLIHCNGDKIVARNTHFISRLNLCNFVGAKRILFDNCHFESTDDALCGTGVYLNSTFKFYSSKPFYRTVGTGAVFLNCNIQSFTNGKQYFTKVPGQVALIDTRIQGDNIEYISWQDVQPVSTKNYQYNTLLNEKPVLVGSKNPLNTVVMDQKEVLNAYRFLLKGNTVYNTYNLLQGNDNWDPMQIKDLVQSKENETRQPFSNLPVQIKITSASQTIESGIDTLLLVAESFRFGSYPAVNKDISWSISEENSSYAKLIQSTYGDSCLVIPTNNTLLPKDVIVTLHDQHGLEAAISIEVLPKIQEAPILVNQPEIRKNHPDTLTLVYSLNTELADRSVISWYRSIDSLGTHAIKVAESNMGKTLRQYTLTCADSGYYIMAGIEPKHIASETGKSVYTVYNEPVQISGKQREYSTNFEQVPVSNQPEVSEGFWTFKDFAGAETNNTYKNAWTWANGQNGAASYSGLIQSHRSAFMCYTPAGQKQSTTMNSKITLLPYKSAGQGFSMAGMYMDVLIKFDAASMSGYALRMVRTTAYNNTVACFFVEYKNNLTTVISDTTIISCFRTPFYLELEATDGKLEATGHTTNTYNANKYSEPIQPKLFLQTTSTNSDFEDYKGFGINYNGGAKTIIKELIIRWESVSESN